MQRDSAWDAPTIEIDIGRAAQIMADIYGAKARAVAQAHMGHSLDGGDIEGFEIWSRLDGAIRALAAGS